MSDTDFRGYAGDWQQMRWAPRDGQDVELLRTTGVVNIGWWIHDCWDTVGGDRLGDDDLQGWRPKEAAL